MFSFFHHYIPNSVLISLGPITIYWYGLFVVLGIIAGTIVAIKLGKKHNIDRETMLDLIFYLIIFGLIGARLYHVLLENPSYYFANPLEILLIWHGGLAIHGGIIAGLITLAIFSSRHAKKLINPTNIEYRNPGDTFWLFTAIISTGAVLGHAIGRWGNYFNQELFGTPTNLPWSIPIDLMHRPTEYISAEFFHPTFLYESLFNIIIFVILILLHRYVIHKNKEPKFYTLITATYLILYSLERFLIEFIKTDPEPIYFGLRLPQIASLTLILASFLVIKMRFHKKIKQQ